MKELVLDFITSYENGISAVAELITTTYQATAAGDASLVEIDRERENLKTGLQEAFARNCSLRRKDFRQLIQGVLGDAERTRIEIEDEQKRVSEKVNEYLKKQQALVTALRQQIVAQAEESTDKNTLDMLISSMKTMYQETGQHLFARLREFQSHLEAFQKEEAELNGKLRRLVARGGSLEIEDLRQLEAVKAHQARKVARELRRWEVEKLLAHFKQNRESSHHRL